ncbi:MAG TPA: hypothetical protein VGM23_10270, partial [Armatimonadota bacterium]
ITAPNAFELLVRSIIGWKNDGFLPENVSMQILDLTGPILDPKFEPSREGLEFPVPSVDIGTFAQSWLEMAMREGHKLPKGMLFDGYQLSMAQIIVAMAALIDETVQKNAFPPYVVIPRVRSPLNWLDIRNPVAVQAPQEVKPPPVIRPDLRVCLNNIDLTRDAIPTPQTASLPPFCGTMRMTITGTGPIATIHLVIDGKERAVYDGVGPLIYDVNTLNLTDVVHTFAVIAVDKEGVKTRFISSFPVQNGRSSGFTPAEIDHPDVDVDVTPTKN